MKPRLCSKLGRRKNFGAAHLRKDYAHLKEMFLNSDQPSFEKVIEDLTDLEKELEEGGRET